MLPARSPVRERKERANGRAPLIVLFSGTDDKLTSAAIKTLGEGEVLKVLSTDRGSLADFPAWAEDTGNEIAGREEEEGILIFYLRKRDEM